jgi:homoserine O-acetyltransferase
LAGNIRAITTDSNWDDGFYLDRPPVRGVRAMAALYAGWGFSEPFYREEGFRAFGASDVEEFIDYFWDQFFQKCDANDLLAQMWTWWHNDLGDHPTFDGDFDNALSAIQARTIVIQSETDQYFPPVDSEFEVSRIPDAELQVIPTTWGHMAPFNPTDQSVIDDALRRLLRA